jgi:hypothetical protein
MKSLTTLPDPQSLRDQIRESIDQARANCWGKRLDPVGKFGPELERLEATAMARAVEVIAGIPEKVRKEMESCRADPSVRYYDTKIMDIDNLECEPKPKEINADHFSMHPPAPELFWAPRIVFDFCQAAGLCVRVTFLRDHYVMILGWIVPRNH